MDVTHSLSGQKWLSRASQVQIRLADKMAEDLRINPAISRILSARGVNKDNYHQFLNPKIRDDLPDPSVLVDMDILVERLKYAIEKKQKIFIFGDYDVDGATSSAILKRYLSLFLENVEIYIPDRFKEGYGPNNEAIDHIKLQGADLLITIDCGVTSFEALNHARDLKLDCVVIDHHIAPLELPPAIAIVNPNRQDDISGLDHLCAAGLAFMVVVALNRSLREAGYFENIPPVNLLSLLDLVALGTVADVVSLTGLNRTFVVQGLEVMKQRQNQGLTALMSASGLSNEPAAYDLGFLLGPRINAGGRIGDAALGANLLTEKDPYQCRIIAEQLDTLNQERRAIEAEIVEKAIFQAEKMMGEHADPPLLIVSGEDWHKGVVGLVASRVKDRFRRPCFAIAIDKEGIATGSGRSISGVDLGTAVRQAVEAGILIKGGGHKMAAGLTLSSNKIGDLRRYLTEKLLSQVETARAQDAIKIDAALMANAAHMGFYVEIEKIGPFGNGNPSPVFVFPNHRIQWQKWVGNGHLKFTITSEAGGKLDVIAFRIMDTPLGNALFNGGDQLFHFAGSLKSNFWQGRTKTQLTLIDAAIPENDSLRKHIK